ncbi:metal-dependent hydrolase [Pseudomonas cavernae]|uniref:Metal-dependent hydrolase n=1 Tax=Pseudomonas cavernae TaxID=2320867 RepID=A0A385Z0D3_9PSED|nr:metal-dependent hydrolase [Pseudomonas cavernae]AYC32204.1 metal-dependent hydrolase [Pseudomonas cavernae]
MNEPHHRLEQRKVRFDFANTPLHWVPNEPEVSHIMNTLHIFLPAGEFWFCKVYNKALPLVTDERLRDDVRGFIKQEAQHARAHDSALEPYLLRHGINPKPFTRRIEWLFDRVLGDYPLGNNAISRRLQHWWLIQRVGLIAAVEHFTCVLGDWIITTRSLDHADPVMLDLLRWHGAEEIEHRCVAHDLHVHLGGSLFMRWLYMFIGSAAVTLMFSTGSRLMMRQDPATRGAPGFLRLWSRLGKRGLLPRMGSIGQAVLRYFQPSFHPRTEGDIKVALDYLASSPAAKRAAAEQMQAAV